MQLTKPPATPAQMWNWQQNALSGMSLLNGYEASGDSYWTQQVSSFEAYCTATFGSMGCNAGLLPGDPPPAEAGTFTEVSTSCVFSYFVPLSTPSGIPHSYADAVILKRYNSAYQYHDWIGWNVPINNVPYPQIMSWPSPSASPLPNTWSYQAYSQNAMSDYVNAVCMQGN